MGNDMCTFHYPVTKLTAQCSQLRAIPSVSYISSAQAKSRLCTGSSGAFDQEFAVSANKGQQLKFTFINLSYIAKSSTLPSEEIGYILHGETEKVSAIESSSKAETFITQTKRHTASVVLSSSPRTSFIIAYQGNGL